MDSSSGGDFEVAAFALVLVLRSRTSRLSTQNGRFGFGIFLMFESSMACTKVTARNPLRRHLLVFPIAAISLMLD